MSSAAFGELAREHLSASDTAVLELCTLEPEKAAPGEAGGAYDVPVSQTSSEFVNKWKEWERVLRLNLAKNRAQKLKREGGFPADVPQDPFDAAGAARAAVAFESPLEAEIFLDRARWDIIESLQGLNIFCETAIYAYMLKLLLMERRAAFNIEEGFTEYKGLYAAILGESK